MVEQFENLSADQVMRWEIPEVGDPTKSSSITPPSVKQLEKVQKNAYEEGFSTGYQEGLQKAEAESQHLKVSLSSVIQNLAVPLQSIDHEIENELVQLVVALCSRLLRKEYEHEPELLMQVIQEAKNQLIMPGTKYFIYLHPSDAKAIQALCNESDASRLEIIEQPTLARGDCQIKTETTDIDGTIETRLHNLLEQHFAERI